MLLTMVFRVSFWFILIVVCSWCSLFPLPLSRLFIRVSHDFSLHYLFSRHPMVILSLKLWYLFIFCFSLCHIGLLMRNLCCFFTLVTSPLLWIRSFSFCYFRSQCKHLCYILYTYTWSLELTIYCCRRLD